MKALDVMYAVVVRVITCFRLCALKFVCGFKVMCMYTYKFRCIFAVANSNLLLLKHYNIITTAAGEIPKNTTKLVSLRQYDMYGRHSIASYHGGT